MNAREIRALNYEVKRRDGFTCTEEGCSQDSGLLVCRVGEGKEPKDFTTRCKPHVGDLSVNPQQWNVPLRAPKDPKQTTGSAK